MKKTNLFYLEWAGTRSPFPPPLSPIPEALEKDPSNETLILFHQNKQGDLEPQGQSSRESNEQITILQVGETFQHGLFRKLAFRYAMEREFKRIIIVPSNSNPQAISEFWQICREKKWPETIMGNPPVTLKSLWKMGGSPFRYLGRKLLSKLQRRLLPLRLSHYNPPFQVFDTFLLKKIPFDRNSNTEIFDSEFLIQCMALHNPIIETRLQSPIPIKSYATNLIKHAWQIFATSLHFKLHNRGFLYDRKFDLGSPLYPIKDSPYSSHSRILSLVMPGSKILDLGCGKGFLANKMISDGSTVDGVDSLPPSEIKAGFRHYLASDFNKDLHSLKKLLNNPYDFIILADIIEHLNRPEELLDFIRNHLSPNSHPVILASTGNVGFFVIRLMLGIGKFNYGPRGILDRTHSCLFTKNSFRKLFEQCGYVVLKEHSLAMPFQAIFPAKKRTSLLLESISQFLANLIPGLFSYQFLLESRPLPTPKQLLEQCGKRNA